MNTPLLKRSPVRAVLPLLLALAACGGGNGDSGNGSDGSGAPPAGNPPSGSVMVTGQVQGGQQPVAGATVQLVAAGGVTEAPPLLLATTTTDVNGKFNIDSLSCPTPTTQLYYVATGGDAGSGNNAALHLLAMLGPCQSIPQSAQISELSTVAAAYALAQFMGAAQADEIAGGSPGLEVAAARALNLVDVVKGAPGMALPAASACDGSGLQPNCGAMQKLDSLADALAACVNSAGPSSNGCAALFCASTPGASFSNASHSCSIPAIPADTLQAALSITLHPGTVSGAGVYALVGSTPVFAPVLAAAPGDWSLALNFGGGGLSEPEAVAVDGDNNLWAANYNKVVSKFDAQGNALSADGFSGGGLDESFGIAIAPDGKVWVSNEQSAGGVNSGHGSLTVLGPDGSFLSGANGYSGGGLSFPVALVIDASGNAWTANDADASISSFGADGTARSPAAGYTGSGLGFPSGIAIDSSGNAWISNTSSNAVTELGNDGTVLSGPSGYTGGGLDGPSSIALDAQGNAWVTNFYGGSITALGRNGQPLSGAPYAAGGLAGPAGIAVDGAGAVWVTNYHGASLSGLAGAGGVSLSPAAGFTGGGLSLPFNPAIDQAGNIWIGNSGNDSITEFIGLAAPVRTPLAGLPARP